MESKNDLVRFDEYMCKHKRDSLADSRMRILNSYFGFTNILSNLHCSFNGFYSEVAHDWSLYLIQQSASVSLRSFFPLFPALDGHDKGKSEKAYLFTPWCLSLAILSVVEGRCTKVTFQGPYHKHSDLTAKSLFQRGPPDHVSLLWTFVQANLMLCVTSFFLKTCAL